MSKKALQELNPKTASYHFLGPPGVTVVTIAVPSILYGIYFGCNENSGGCPPALATIPQRITSSVSNPTWWKGMWDTEAVLLYFGWYTFCVVAWAIIPGEWVEGTLLRNGERKLYKINAFSSFLLALGFTSGWIIRNGPKSFTFIYYKWPAFVTAALINSILQAFWCYFSSFREGALLALGGNSGNFIYDWFIGRELNPSIGPLDLMSFNELRPGLILWVLIDISMLCEQAVRRGGFANVTDSMWLVVIFQTWYVGDSLYNEPALFTTMDIIYDGFGFMLSVGDLAWVPFTYSIQAQYLVYHQLELGIPASLSIIFTNFVGYYIFRAANGEKNDFRNGRNAKNLKWMDTKRGTKLLVSGWWGWSRHPNYLGDLIMAYAWCLPSGFESPVTYFYPIYFTILLLHREHRDDETCQQKYGDDWLEYKKRVPYRILPYVY